MNPDTFDITLDNLWHYAIWTCALSAALLSVSFIFAIVGSALWQTVTDAHRIIRHHVNISSLFSHVTRFR